MTIEEKAKAYDEAIERANELNYVSDKDSLQRKTVEHIFPELAESKDEKIRKELIEFFKWNAQMLNNFDNKEVLAWLEKQGEQKPDDKVEPKFKVGDWVVVDGVTQQVTQIRPEGFYTDRAWNSKLTFNDVHLWTLQDAKDGDVLHCWIDGDEFVLIYKGIKDGYITTYCHLYQNLKSFSEEPTTMFCRTIQGHFTPATKEQRDLLFQKMKEARYGKDF